MRDRTAARLAWGCLALVLTLALIEGVLTVQAGRPADVSALLFLGFPAVGALIAARQPGNAVGWVMLGIGGFFLVGTLAMIYHWAATDLLAGYLPGADVALAVTSPLWVPLIGTMGGIVPMIFPDGHVPSPRWRPVLRANVAALAALYVLLLVWPGSLEVAGFPDRDNPLGIAALEPYTESLFLVVLVVPLSFVLAVASLVGRYRRARGRLRVQLKWFVSAVTFVGALYAVMMLLHVPYRGGAPPAWVDAAGWVGISTFVLIPLAIGVAILRHRLFDIDRIINRAVVYAAVTAIVSGVYLVAVTLAQQALRPATGGSELAVASSTLLAAAALRPVRRGVQTFTDRRFHRSRYDAVRTTERFADGLRRQTDLGALTRDLPEVVGQVLRPAHVSLWLASTSAGATRAADQA